MNFLEMAFKYMLADDHSDLIINVICLNVTEYDGYDDKITCIDFWYKIWLSTINTSAFKLATVLKSSINL